VSELQGIGRFRFQEGKLEEFKRLSAQAMEIAQAKDTGTLQYEVYFSDDESEAIVLERYRDSEALIEHATNLGEIGQAIPRRDWSPASSLVSRAPSSERSWLAARSVSLRPSYQCRHRPRRPGAAGDGTVHRVHARRTHLDQHLPGSRLGIGNLHQVGAGPVLRDRYCRRLDAASSRQPSLPRMLHVDPRAQHRCPLIAE
jgi:quinol monooxygenase YgiN